MSNCCLFSTFHTSLVGCDASPWFCYYAIQSLSWPGVSILKIDAVAFTKLQTPSVRANVRSETVVSPFLVLFSLSWYSDDNLFLIDNYSQ